MRVLHVTPSIATAYGGPTQSLRGYVEACRSEGIDAHVATPRAPEADSVPFRELVGAGLHEFASLQRGAAVFAPGLMYWLARNIRAYDVLHVHGLLNPVSSVSARIGVAHGIPTIVRPCGTMSRYTATYRRSALKALYFRAIDRPNLRRVGAIHFTSDQEQLEAMWHGVGISALGHVIAPPYIGDSSPPVAREPRGRTILFIGRFHPVKNLEALLEAWDEVACASDNARLVLAGTGQDAYVRALRTRAQRLSSAQSVSFVGFADSTKKDQLFSEAAMLVLPSHHENFGMAALEAIAHGVPVVLTPHVHFGRFVTEHRLGMVSDDDPGSLALAITTVLRDDALRNQCLIRGPELVRQFYSPAVIGVTLRKLYESVIAGRRP